MTLYDISIAMGPGTPEWPGDTPFSCGWSWRLAKGESVNLSWLTTSPHVGTHADAPLHVRDGDMPSHELPLAVFIGAARLCTVPPEPRDLDIGELARIGATGAERLLLRSGASIAGGRFPEDWPALSADAARALARQGLRLLGVDAPSVDRRASTTLDVHHALFDGGAHVLENLDLGAAPDGEYELLAQPLHVVGLDAAPVRALLRRP